jgi:hypothetical protein
MPPSSGPRRACYCTPPPAQPRPRYLAPLKDMPLKELWCDFKPARDAEILRAIKTLEKINGKPAAEFWKEVDTKKKEQ